MNLWHEVDPFIIIITSPFLFLPFLFLNKYLLLIQNNLTYFDVFKLVQKVMGIKTLYE